MTQGPLPSRMRPINILNHARKARRLHLRPVLQSEMLVNLGVLSLGKHNVVLRLKST